jgi:hypothetical protein
MSILKLREEFANTSNRLKYAYDKNLTTDNLHTCKITNLVEYDAFKNACHAVFIRTLFDNDVHFLVNGSIHQFDFMKGAGEVIDRSEAKKANGAARAAAKKLTSDKVIFDFTIGIRSLEDKKQSHITAEHIYNGTAKVVTKDGTENPEVLDKLKYIKTVALIAAKDPETFNDRVNAELEEIDKRARRTRSRAASRALDVALDAGDADEIEKAYAEVADARAASAEAEAAAAKAKHDEVVEDIRKTEEEELELLGITDANSFILGWLAANVTYMHAQIPKYRRPNGTYDMRDVNIFRRRYGNNNPQEVKSGPGYIVRDHKYYETTGKLLQRYTAMYIHFANSATDLAPGFIRGFLDSFESERYHCPSKIGNPINSKSLAVYLYSLGFTFTLTDPIAADTCRKSATNARDFELGFNWTRLVKSGRKGRRGDDPVDIVADGRASAVPDHALDLNFPEPKVTTASDYGKDYADPTKVPVAPF